MSRPRHLSPGDYANLIRERERQAEERRQELRSKFRVIRKPAQIYGWTELILIHPDGENADVPPPWIWSSPGQFWYLLAPDHETDSYEEQIKELKEKKP